jgi:hypothetical protein
MASTMKQDSRAFDITEVNHCQQAGCREQKHYNRSRFLACFEFFALSSFDLLQPRYLFSPRLPSLPSDHPLSPLLTFSFVPTPHHISATPSPIAKMSGWDTGTPTTAAGKPSSTSFDFILPSSKTPKPQDVQFTLQEDNQEGHTALLQTS